MSVLVCGILSSIVLIPKRCRISQLDIYYKKWFDRYWNQGESSLSHLSPCFFYKLLLIIRDLS